MSIALSNRIKELEAMVQRFDKVCQEASYRIVMLEKRLSELENRPKPGRPPKHG